VRLEDSRLKIERADKHIADIEARIGTLHESQFSTVKIDPKTGCETLTYDFSDSKAFDDIALMLGDAIHNLNCALDYTWLRTIEKLVPRAVPDRAKFPVHEAAKELEGSLKKAEVHTTSPALFKFMMTEIKPYHGGDSAIWPVHRLSIRDKHRLLIPVWSTAVVTYIELEDQTGKTLKGFASTVSLQRPPYFLSYPQGIHIKHKGKIAAQIIVENENLAYLMRLPETLQIYSQSILVTIKEFERFLRLNAK
jgi:hypothetical protein